MPLPTGSVLKRLSHEYGLSDFDCGDKDLNDFLLNDSKSYLKKLLAVTYVLESQGKILAFFSLLNDKVTITDAESNRKWWKLFGGATGKKFKSHPAMKIGRFAVCKEAQKSGLGCILLDYIKYLFIDNNRTGCRYITVDAYQQSLKFYEKNQFEYLTSNDQGKDTRLMYFDLIRLCEL